MEGLVTVFKPTNPPRDFYAPSNGVEDHPELIDSLMGLSVLGEKLSQAM